MNKTRIENFMDAMLAIIMTVLVLNMKVPDPVTWNALWDVRNQLTAYAMSFFWLGSLWISMLGVWGAVRRITYPVVWLLVLMLFFVSFFPYCTNLVSEHFNDAPAQIIWGTDTVIISFVNWFLHYMLSKADPENKDLVKRAKDYRDVLIPDLGVKLIGLLVSIFIWPPAMMVAVGAAAAMLFLIKPLRKREFEE
jgi:uncharacterized membrane protein